MIALFKHKKLKLKFAVALTTALVVMINTGSQLSYAQETTSKSGSSSTSTTDAKGNKNNTSTVGQSDEWTPRFPVGRGGNLSGLSGSSSNSSGNTDDADWVEHKDDLRHGVSGGSTWGDIMDKSGVKPDGHSGDASGTYAIDLGGKSYYWYHQSTKCPGCTYCGTWSNMIWGGGGAFGSDGCAIYSLSIIASNLTGQEITPSKLLTDMGCKINDSNTYCDTVPSSYINGHGLALGGEGIGQFMCDTYGLQMETGFNSLSKSDCQAKVNEILDKGGMVWYRYSGGSWNSWYTSSHYIPIRAYDDKGYYLLDECLTPESGGNEKPVSFDALYNESYKDSYFMGFYVGGSSSTKSDSSNKSDSKSNNKSDSKSNNSSVSSTGNDSAYSMWAGPASQLKQYSNTVDLGNGFKLYDGLPWAAEANTFAIDADTALIAIQQYVESLGSSEKPKCTSKYMQDASGNYSAIELLKSDGIRMHNEYPKCGPNPYSSDTWTNEDGGKYVTRDGIKCIGVCVAPCYQDWDYNVDFGPNEGDTINDKNRWSIASGSNNDVYGAKSAMVLYEKDTQKLWYLPAVSIDAKAHTFPGGLLQTGISLKTCKLGADKLPTEYNVLVASGGEYGGAEQSGPMSSLMDLMNKSFGGHTVWDNTWNVFECWYAPNCVDSKIFDSGKYVAVGYVRWPTEK